MGGQVAVRVAREGSLLVLRPEARDPVLGPLTRACLSFQVPRRTPRDRPTRDRQ